MMITSARLLNVLNAKIIFLGILSLFLYSCKSGETLADKGIIQKRKYQKGYHVNIKSPFEAKENVAQSEKTSEESFTESLRAELPTGKVAPVLSEPIARESKLPAEKKNRKHADKVQSKSKVDRNSGEEATASLDEVKKWKSEQGVYSNDNKLKSQPQDYYSARRLNTLALLSFIFGVLSFFIMGLPFGIAAVILGIIGIVQVENKRDIYKGQGFAIVGLILGIVAVVIMLAYLSSEA